MTYQNALKIKIGDTLRSKDGFTFVVEKITDENNSANTQHYKKFSGKCTKGFLVYYKHKDIR